MLAVASPLQTFDGGAAAFGLEGVELSLVRWWVQSVETVNEGDGCFLGDFGFDVFAEGSGPEDAEVLPLSFALGVGFDGGHQQIVSGWEGEYF